MEKIHKSHLESVTPENLREWKNKNAFSCFASSSGKSGSFRIGVDGNGNYIVNDGVSDNMYPTAKVAVDKYAELFTKD